MEQEELELKLLEVFGYTPKDLKCANAFTALGEIFDKDAGENVVSFLELFVSSLEVEQLIELKKLVSV